METRMDADTTLKIDKINKKIEEINQRRYGLRTTRIEDELDRQELDDYIGSLNLTSEQKNLIDGYNKTNARTMQNQNAFYYGMMIISVFIEAYLGYAIIDLIMQSMQSTPDIFTKLYLGLMIVVFIVNAFYVMKFLRIIK